MYGLKHQRAQDPARFAAAVHAVGAGYRQAPHLHAPGVQVVSTDEKTGRQALERLHATRPTTPGRIARWECADMRHGTLALMANFAVATGQVLAPSLGPTRTADDFAQPLAKTIDPAPEAPWMCVLEQLHIHTSAALVRLVAERCQLDGDLGGKGHSGMMPSMATRAAFVQDKPHRMRVGYTPKHTSWLPQVEIWCSILVRRLLKRASFVSVEALHARIVAFIEYFNIALAKPFKWTYTGRPLSA
jgi:hypothetical protein